VDGLIVMSPELDARSLERNLTDGLPIVLLNGVGDGRRFDSIRVDNYGGALAMVRHLISLGHRRIAHVAGPAGNQDAAERRRGYRDAIRSVSSRWSQELAIAGDFREEAGYRAGRHLLDWKNPPTAVFAGNDAMAIGLLAAFQERHVRVPQDLAVAGFDDIPIARFATPPLSTVRVPIAELGARATRCLLNALSVPSRHARGRETVPTTLVIRSSCGAASAGKTRVPRETGFKFRERRMEV
jgi:LacI family transcriptional regulator